MNVFLHGFGAGSTLNFRGRRYTTREELLGSVAAENTVGVVTSADMTGWRIVDAWPEELESGMLYILAGAGGTVEVALSRQVRLHLAGARLNGEYLDAWIYQNGAWVQFAQAWRYYFKQGDLCEDVTGGWTTDYAHYNYGSGIGVLPGDGDTTIGVYTTGNTQAAPVGTVDPVDLSGVDTLYITVDSATANATGVTLAFRVLTAQDVFAKAKEVSLLGAAGEVTLDVSDLSGEYYLALVAITGGTSSTITAYVSEVRGR